MRTSNVDCPNGGGHLYARLKSDKRGTVNKVDRARENCRGNGISNTVRTRGRTTLAQSDWKVKGGEKGSMEEAG